MYINCWDILYVCTYNLYIYNTPNVVYASKKLRMRLTRFEFSLAIKKKKNDFRYIF